MNFHAKSVQCSRKNIDLRNRRLGFVLILPLSSLDNQMTFWNLCFSFVKVDCITTYLRVVVRLNEIICQRTQQKGWHWIKTQLMLYMSSQKEKIVIDPWVAGVKAWKQEPKGTLHKSENTKFTFFLSYMPRMKLLWFVPGSGF